MIRTQNAKQHRLPLWEPPRIGSRFEGSLGVDGNVTSSNRLVSSLIASRLLSHLLASPRRSGGHSFDTDEASDSSLWRLGGYFHAEAAVEREVMLGF